MTVPHSQHALARNGAAPKLGIVGGGQLAKMTAAAATRLGCEVVVLERPGPFPARSVATQSLEGDWNDPRELLRLASMCDRVTLENEFVNPDALAAIEAAGHALVPSVAALRQVQDKLLQKRTFEAAGLKVVEFADAPDIAAARTFGFPSVLKKRRNSYDGKGNASVDSAAALESAWASLGGGRNALYVERRCELRMELAVIVTRGAGGEEVCYPVVESTNRDHICNSVVCPADIPEGLARRAADFGLRAVRSIGGVGSFGVEFFLETGGEILVNEIAPRVHNTGHYTIEACACSQFENHVRAVFGWPLGSPALAAPGAAMVNLLGAGEGSGAPGGFVDALAVPGAHVHVYGKTRSARGRKMGHVTALGPSGPEALAIAQRAADCIRFGD